MEIAKVQPSDYGLEPKKANELTISLNTTLQERELLLKEFADVSKLDITEETIPLFKELRLKFVKNRTQGITKWHKVNKEYFLAGGRFIDAVKNKEISVNEEIEQKLNDAEKHFENIEAERIQKLQNERFEMLKEYVEDELDIPENLGFMSDEFFETFLTGTKAGHEKRIKEREEEKLKEEERQKKVILYNERKELLIPYWNHLKEDLKSADYGELPQESFDIILHEAKQSSKKYDEEQAEIRKENERLKIEADKKAKEDAEKEKQRLKKEAEQKKENDRLAAELKKKEDAERQRKADEEARIEAEASKGDAQKIADLIADFEAIKTKYEFKSVKNKAKFENTKGLIDKTINYIKDK